MIVILIQNIVGLLAGLFIIIGIKYHSSICTGVSFILSIVNVYIAVIGIRKIMDLRRFKIKKDNTMAYIDILKHLIIKDLGEENIKIKYNITVLDDLGPNVHGRCSMHNDLNIHMEIKATDNLYNLAETLAHEFRHIYQFSNNMDMIICSIGIEYRHQPMELDARTYASDFIERHKSAILEMVKAI